MNDYIAKPVDERLLYNKIIGQVRKPYLPKFRVSDFEEKVILKKRKCTDLQYLNTRTKSNPKLMMEMISLYLEQTPPLISAMNKSYQNKDWGSLQAAVHKMIPSFSIMGISTDFENMARKVQEYASGMDQTMGINEMIFQLADICTQACKELEIELDRIKNGSE